MLSFLMWSMIFVGVKLILSIEKLVDFSKGGSVLEVFMVLHWSLKYSLKRLHFSLMSVINVPS